MWFLKKRSTYLNEFNNEKYYDCHTHILPAVDDGAPTMKMAIRMLQEEAKQGVSHVILTPHLRKNENESQKIKKHFRAFQAQARKCEIEVEIYLGCEIYFDSDTLRKLKAGEAFTIAGSRYVLVEFSPFASWSSIVNAMNDLTMNGYFPILAHAERYECILENFSRVDQLVERGVYIQLNANSFLKHPFRKKLLRKLEEGFVHFIGTDSHRTDWRPVCMKETYEYLAKMIDKSDFYRVFFENPRKLINNEVI